MCPIDSELLLKLERVKTGGVCRDSWLINYGMVKSMGGNKYRLTGQGMAELARLEALFERDNGKLFAVKRVAALAEMPPLPEFGDTAEDMAFLRYRVGLYRE